MTQIEQAGFIVCDDTAIWGQGKTEDEAWADMIKGMTLARVRVVEELEVDARGDAEPDQTLASRFHIVAASAALMRDVEDRGGNITWRKVGGVACTKAEDEETS